MSHPFDLRAFLAERLTPDLCVVRVHDASTPNPSLAGMVLVVREHPIDPVESSVLDGVLQDAAPTYPQYYGLDILNNGLLLASVRTQGPAPGDDAETVANAIEAVLADDEALTALHERLGQGGEAVTPPSRPRG